MRLNLKIHLLNREQIAQIYHTRMVQDFPPMELKPLQRMQDAYDQGNYVCYALLEEGKDIGPATKAEDILAYAFFVKMDNHYLFDYLAVSSDKRNSGLGTSFLELLHGEFADSDSVIGEVEDPDCAENDTDRELQTRRLGFYLRNGYINTGIKVVMFDVDYIVLEMDLGKNHDRQTISNLYQEHYKAMLPREMFLAKIRMKN